ncbi:hypothetical protein ACW0JT_12795 [Arthrobacter sp. SA17]
MTVSWYPLFLTVDALSTSFFMRTATASIIACVEATVSASPTDLMAAKPEEIASFTANPFGRASKGTYALEAT